MNDFPSKNLQTIYDKPIRILLTGGGSGGPTQPLIALVEELENKKLDQNFFFWEVKMDLRE